MSGGWELGGALPHTPAWFGSGPDRWWWDLVVRVGPVDSLTPLRIVVRHGRGVQYGRGVYYWTLPGGVLVGAWLGQHTLFWRVSDDLLPDLLTTVIALQRSWGYVDWY